MTFSTYAGASFELAPGCSSLPDPDLVNKFLLNNCSEWTNPVLGAQPEALQVIRCKSIDISGLSYDFYQAQAPSQTCERPPPLETVIHHREVALSGRWFWYPWTVAASLSLFTLAVVAVVVVWLLGNGIFFAVASPVWFFWEHLVDGLTKTDLEDVVEESHERLLEQPGSRSVSEDAKLTTERMTSRPTRFSRKRTSAFVTSPLYLRILSAETAHRVEQAAEEAYACVFFVLFSAVNSCSILFLIFVMGLISPNTPKAAKCLYPEAWNIETLGPVRLPDPTQGLNRYLVSTPRESNRPLKLCTTDRLQFYVGCSTQCADLAEPYADRLPVAGPTVDDGCPSSKFRTLVWVGIGLATVVLLAIVASVIACVIMCNQGQDDDRSGLESSQEIEMKGLDQSYGGAEMVV